MKLDADEKIDSTSNVRHEIQSLKELIETRLNGYDSAIELLQNNADKAPSVAVIAERVSNAEEINKERFSSIQLQFKERDVRIDQTSSSSKVAVDAALQAAKEAVEKQNTSSALAISKSEAATTKQIENIVELIRTSSKGVDDKYNDLKDRVVAIEAKTIGAGQERRGLHDNMALILGGIGLLISIVLLILKFV